MGNNKKKNLFEKVLSLYRKNINQKDIALKVGVCERTITIWLKDVKSEVNFKKENLKILNSQLTKLINDPNSKTEDIKNITTAIYNLNK